MQEEYEWFWLCSVPGLYEVDRRKLLSVCRSPEEVRKAASDAGKHFPFLNPAKCRALQEHQRIFDAQEEYHKQQRQGIHFISRAQPAYPQALREIPDPPSGLFYRGELPKEDETCVAVIGARMCSDYGRRMARELAQALAEQGVSVVSGMAYGIDAEAQTSALKAEGKSYGVLGCGVDICYPKENRALFERLQLCGGVLSEYCPRTPALPFHFPMRNRIISGLSRLVVVVEARKKSGTLITADMALEQGRDVFAFPGRTQDVLSAGCNRLIQQGAGIITDIEEFLKVNGFLTKKTFSAKNCNIGLATPEIMVYSCLDSATRSLQQLAKETKLSPSELASAIGALQVKGLIAETAKNHYAKIR